MWRTIYATSSWGDELCCNSGASCKRVEGNTFSKKKFTNWAANCCTMLDGFEGFTFFNMPLDAKNQ